MDARNADKEHKVSMARELYEYEMFSLTQLAKIVRLNTRTVAMHLSKNSVGGRFSPEALTSLIAMRQQQLQRERVTPSLLRVVLESGTSFSCAVALTGISYSSYYKDVPKEFRRETSGED
jgi:hypothetical protein